MATSRQEAFDFTTVIGAGDAVMWNHAGAEPLSLILQLLDQRHHFGGRISVMLSGVSFSGLLRPEHTDVIDFRSIGGLGTHEVLARAKCLDMLPMRFSDMPLLIKQKKVPVDIFLASVSNPDTDGYVSLGPTAAVSLDALAAARIAVAQINPRLPWIEGDGLIALDRFDHVVFGEHELPEAPSAPAGSAETDAICHSIASYVQDGATLQLGIGSIGASLPRFLHRKRGLGIHSALLTEGLMQLMTDGIADGSAKTIDRGLAVAGELFGSRALYEFADRHPLVRLRGTDYLLAESTFDSFDSFVSVNGALQVDVTGQVNAELRGEVHAGAVGGQVDFVRAGARSPHGVSIIALPSTTRGGQSRIVRALDGGVVTTPRHEVDVIITEHGVAELRGKSIAERITAMAAIAAPSHRDELSSSRVYEMAGSSATATERSRSHA